jgi:hypothetical protein
MSQIMPISAKVCLIATYICSIFGDGGGVTWAKVAAQFHSIPMQIAFIASNVANVILDIRVLSQARRCDGQRKDRRQD